MGESTFEEVRKPRRYAPAFYHAFFFVLAANL